ncbi:MAG TPA: hypothetical protein VF198_02385 [Vicinamibacterales bacterium]
MTPTIQIASISPATPPASAIARLSASSWRTRRARLAPMAARTAISRSRSTPRASSRFAMLAQATSSSAATAVANRRSAGRTCP